jgi:hypothetical protein
VTDEEFCRIWQASRTAKVAAVALGVTPVQARRRAVWLRFKGHELKHMGRLTPEERAATPQLRAAQKRARRLERKLAGLCADCGGPSPERTRCRECRPAAERVPRPKKPAVPPRLRARRGWGPPCSCGRALCAEERDACIDCLIARAA